MRLSSLHPALMLLIPGLLAAQAPPAPEARAFQSYWSAEYLWPTKPDRPIRTVTADVGVGRVLSAPLGLTIGVGLTATWASGHIYQLNDALGTDTLETSAFGLGPSVRLAIMPLRLGRVSLGAEASAGLIFYSERFPAGGEYYNGMLRVGPSLSVALGEADRLTVAGKWMHVSNGQGLVPENPSYEALGLSIGVTHGFSRPALTPSARRRQLVAGIAGGVVGAVGAALLSRHCSGDSCRIGAGITAVGALTGAATGVVVASF